MEQIVEESEGFIARNEGTSADILPMSATFLLMLARTASTIVGGCHTGYTVDNHRGVPYTKKSEHRNIFFLSNNLI